MFKNNLKRKLKNNDVCFGTFIASNAPDTVEICGILGFDFIVIDAEHGYVSPETSLPMIRAAQGRNMTPIVRISENSEALVLRTLDTGAEGIHIPQINTVSDGEKAIRYSKYFPLGTRGLSFHRACGYGTDDINKYLSSQNDETLVVFHCENEACLDDIDKIAAIEGLDVLIYGPFDMSQSMGIPGQVNHPDVEAGAQKMLDACKRNNVAAGIFCSDIKSAEERISQGFTYITVGVDCKVIADAYANIINGLRAIKIKDE